MKANAFEMETAADDGELASTAVEDLPPTVRAPAAIALALAAGHLIEAGVHAHRFMNLADAARRMGISGGRVTRLTSLIPLAPEIQTEVLGLRVDDPLGGLSERALLELVGVHADWRVQRWWWSLLAQPFDPDWLEKGGAAAHVVPFGHACPRGRASHRRPSSRQAGRARRASSPAPQHAVPPRSPVFRTL